MWHKQQLSAQTAPSTTVKTKGDPITLEGVPAALAGMTFYLALIVVKLRFTLTQAGGTGVALNGEDLWRVISKMELNDGVNRWFDVTPQRYRRFLLAELGKEPIDLPAQIPAANGAYTRDVYVPLMFIQDPAWRIDEQDYLPPVGTFMGSGFLQLEYDAPGVVAMSPGSSISAFTATPCLYLIPRRGGIKLPLITQVLDFNFQSHRFEMPPGIYDTLIVARDQTGSSLGYPNAGPAVYDQAKIDSGLRINGQLDTEFMIVEHGLTHGHATDDAERIDNGLQAAAEAVDWLPVIVPVWRDRLTRAWATVSQRQVIEFFGGSLPATHHLIARRIHTWAAADQLGRDLAQHLGLPPEAYENASPVDARRNAGAASSFVDAIRNVLPRRMAA